VEALQRIEDRLADLCGHRNTLDAERATTGRAAIRKTRRMLFMVIERYTHGPEPVYRRAADKGRMLPDGLRYIDSWIVDDGAFDRCFQLMATDDPSLFDVWLANWRDLGEFEVIPVINSSDAASRVGVTWQGGS
jgi:uncharacterized protein DUF3303